MGNGTPALLCLSRTACSSNSAALPTQDEALLIESALDSRYVAVFDPLDGSSNIDASICTGTIFGVLRDDAGMAKDEFRKSGRTQEIERIKSKPKDSQGGDMDSPSIESLLQPGKELAASGYCMYSSSTILVFTLGGSNPVIGFTLDPQLGEVRVYDLVY